MVGLAFEVHDTYNRKRNLLKLNEKINESLKNADQSQTSMEKINTDSVELSKLKLEIEFLSLDPLPNVFKIFLYAYCYIGLLTGPYFKYRTYHDWVFHNTKQTNEVDSYSFMLKRGRIVPFIIIGFLALSKFVSFQVNFYEHNGNR